MSIFVIAIIAPPHKISPAKSSVKIDESTIEAGDDGTFGIDIEYVLGSGNNIESKLQVGLIKKMTTVR